MKRIAMDHRHTTSLLHPRFHAANGGDDHTLQEYTSGGGRTNILKNASCTNDHHNGNSSRCVVYGWRDSKPPASTQQLRRRIVYGYVDDDEDDEDVAFHDALNSRAEVKKVEILKTASPPPKIDPTLMEVVELASEPKFEAATHPLRRPTNVFRGLGADVLAGSVLREAAATAAKRQRLTDGTALLLAADRRACRVGFGANFMLAYQKTSSISSSSSSTTTQSSSGGNAGTLATVGAYPTSVNLARLNVVPTIEYYMRAWLVESAASGAHPRDHRRAAAASIANEDALVDAELERHRRSALLRWNPPSTLLKLADLFILNASRKDMGDSQVLKLFEAILVPQSEREGIIQRVRFGDWLRVQLNSTAVTAQQQHQHHIGGRFRAIYTHLINGRVDEAMEASKRARLYCLTLVLALYKVPPSAAIRAQIRAQLEVCHRQRRVLETSSQRHSAGSAAAFAEDGVHYQRILGLLAGAEQFSASKDGAAHLRQNRRSNNEDGDAQLHPMGDCLVSLSWLQVLGIICWYWSEPAATLADCVLIFENLQSQRIIAREDLYKY